MKKHENYKEALTLLCDDLNILFKVKYRNIDYCLEVYDLIDRYTLNVIGEITVSDEDVLRYGDHNLVMFKSIQTYYRNNKEHFVNVYKQSSLL